MDTRPQFGPADWLSRIIAVVSLAVAIGAVVYLRMNQNQPAEIPETLKSDFQAELADGVAEYKQAYEQKQADLENQFQTALKSYDEWLTLTKQWNGQLGSALDKFQQDADQLLVEIATKEADARKERQLTFRQQLQSLELTSAGGPADSATQDDQSTSPPPEDSLAVLHTVQRPTRDTEHLIRIENSGSEDALIERVRFVPQTDFQAVAGEQDVSIMSGAEEIVTLAFSSSDNTSTKPGMHGLYDRTIAEPIRVPAGDTLTFRVLIEDSKHENWGFAGKLVLDYNGQEPLVVDSARVLFQMVKSGT